MMSGFDIAQNHKIHKNKKEKSSLYRFSSRCKRI